MRKSILILFLLWSFLGYSQNDLYCLNDFAGLYRLSTINTTTGVITEIAPIPSVGFYVLGNKQCIRTHNDTYTFTGYDGVDARLYTLDLATAAVITSPLFNNVVVGLQYNCIDSTVYALEEVAGNYYLVGVDIATGITTQIGIVGGVAAYIGDSFTLDMKTNLYHFFGIFNSDVQMYSVDIYTGLVTASPLFPDNVTGLAYNCNDSAVYGIWEDGLDYKLEKIDPITGTHTTIGILNNIDPGLIGESASISRTDEYTYRGFSNFNSVLLTIDVQNANIIGNVAFTANVAGMDYYNCCLDEPVTSIDEIINWKKLSISPNPFIDKVKIEWDRYLTNATIEVFDLYGRIVFSKKGLTGTSFILDKNQIARGVYLVDVKGGNKFNWTGKIVAE